MTFWLTRIKIILYKLKVLSSKDQNKQLYKKLYGIYVLFITYK